MGFRTQLQVPCRITISKTTTPMSKMCFQSWQILQKRNHCSRTKDSFANTCKYFFLTYFLQISYVFHIYSCCWIKCRSLHLARAPLNIFAFAPHFQHANDHLRSQSWNKKSLVSIWHRIHQIPISPTDEPQNVYRNQEHPKQSSNDY